MRGSVHLQSIGLVIGIFTLLSIGFATQEQAGKPFTQWSRSEAEAILNNSPWAIRNEVRIKFDKETQVAAGSYSGVSSAAAAQSQTEVTSQVPVDFIFTLRLRSALPVRQALVRLRQLQSYFARLDDRGAPLLGPENKQLVINLTDNQINPITNFKVDVSSLMVNGKVEF